MITVNLLPPDLRPVERTPLPRFLVIVVGVALAAVALVLLTFIYFIWIPRVHTQIANKEQELTNLRAQAGEYETLSAALQNITQREKALEEIYRTRTIWWKKLALLSDLTPSYVGLTTLGFKQPTGVGRAAQAADAGTLKVESIAARAEEKRVASYRRILKGELPPQWGSEADKELGQRFIGDFVDGEILDYGWKVVELPEYPDLPAIKFTLEMKLKPKVTPPVTRPMLPAAVRQPGGTR